MFACYPHTMKELALNAEEPFLRSTFLECWRTSKMLLISNSIWKIEMII